MKAILLAAVLLPVAVLAQVRPGTESEIAIIQKAMESRLKDPDSMRLQNVRFAPNKTEGMQTVCGEVNAKNSYGGYVGFRGFYAVYIANSNKGTPVAAVIGVDDGRTNAASIMCKKEGL